MPYKDPAKAKAQKHANYLKNKEVYIQRAKDRRIRLQNDRSAQKALASIGPVKPKQMFCIDCNKDITFTYSPKHGARCEVCVAKYMKAYREANKDRIALQKKAWAEVNRNHKAAQDKNYALANKEARATARNKWKAANPDKDRAAKAANRADRIMRVPAWANRERIRSYYNVCGFFNEVNGYAKYHVDHIIPLNGKAVSGLHVHNNLQVILAKENLQKGASYG